MLIDQFSLSDLPHPVDLFLFWGMVLSIGLGWAFALKKIAEAIERTDQFASRDADVTTSSPPPNGPPAPLDRGRD
ncbi:MAG: hypothetical protein K2Z25_02310 [Beijerinckiaceae bacterium]|nr:hypothetical protein [Beijerinckiaceae bacterium]